MGRSANLPGSQRDDAAAAGSRRGHDARVDGHLRQRVVDSRLRSAGESRGR